LFFTHQIQQKETERRTCLVTEKTGKETKKNKQNMQPLCHYALKKR